MGGKNEKGISSWKNLSVKKEKMCTPAEVELAAWKRGKASTRVEEAFLGGRGGFYMKRTLCEQRKKKKEGKKNGRGRFCWQGKKKNNGLVLKYIDQGKQPRMAAA